ncbi:MAG: hypothetical protein GY790_23940 [Bacteroidetes bacterium]|nr:hypothetical protein [Bacteroidota bacterium]
MGCRKLLIVLWLLVGGINIHAQLEDIGLPFITNYFHEEYSAGTQNWSISQDSGGLMYFGNNKGVLQFDGTNWNLYSLPNNSIVRSVNWINNKLYAGGFGEFGYFAADENGILIYNSLSDSLKEPDRTFGEIWRIFSTEYGIVFQSFLKIFIVSENGITVLSPKSRFGFSYYTNNNLFVVDRDIGLGLLTSKGTFPIFSDTTFFKENEITFIISVGLDDYLVGTTNNGIYQFNGTELSPWRVEISRRFEKEQIYSGLKLDNEKIAVGTIQNGVYIIDLQGEVIQHLNRPRGLQNNTVLSLYQDNLENLWLGLDNGIDALEVSSPITYLDHFYGIETSYASIAFNRMLYIGTNQGLFVKPVSEIARGFLDRDEFQMVEGVVGQVWSLGEFNGKLICGNNLGTYVVDGFSSHQISSRMGGWNYVEVPGTDDQLIGGSYTGLELYSYSSGSRHGWKKVNDIKHFEESCKELLFDKDNYLWITHAYKGIFRLKLSDDLLSVDSVSIYNQTGGLPALPYSLSRINGELHVVTGNGLYAYDSRRDSFLLDNKYDLLLNNEPGLTHVKEDYRGDLWYFTTTRMGVLRKQEDGSYLKITKPFKRIQNKYLGSNNENVFVYDRNSVFIGGERGVFHYNQNKQKQYEATFRTFIGKVELKGRRQDSILHYNGINRGSVVIPYRLNSITAHYFAPYFEASGHLIYSYKLEGFDEKWSPWESRNIKGYTNLREGEYEFLVKAKNIYDHISDVAHLKFTITPPFFRTTGAYVLYLIILLLITALIIIMVDRRIRRARDREQERYRKELLAKEETYLEGAKLSNREIERLKNEQLVIEMRHKDMELANSTMYLVRKNKFLNQVKSEILDLIGNLSAESNKHALREIVHRIDRDIKSKQHWKVFDKYFDEVHEDFLSRLKESYPDLTPKELRLCAYLRMNISTKEIAPLMNISVRGVEISRYRLRKKLDIDQGVNLTDYILSI